MRGLDADERSVAALIESPDHRDPTPGEEAAARRMWARGLMRFGQCIGCGKRSSRLSALGKLAVACDAAARTC